jgi:hypothetical protein
VIIRLWVEFVPVKVPRLFLARVTLNGAFLPGLSEDFPILRCDLCLFVLHPTLAPSTKIDQVTHKGSLILAEGIKRNDVRHWTWFVTLICCIRRFRHRCRGFLCL